MGTLYRVVLYAADDEGARAAADAAFDRVGQLDAMMTDYRDDSELMQLSARAGGPPVPVSPDLFRIIAASVQLAQETDGAFDITVGPVVKLWRHARRTGELPDPERLAHARALVGSDKIRLDAEKQTVQLTVKDMRLDLGGIAKGYAAAEALAVLKAHGIRSALVAGGGDISVSAAPPGTRGWTIGVAPLEATEKPSGESGAMPRLLLENASISTSGDIEQHVEIAGQRYSHIIDPRTGEAVTGRTSVTVVTPDGARTDGLATAFSVLGAARTRELAERLPHVAVFFTQATPQGEERFESSGWRKLRIKN
jgi:FAD:protein FMN transferase